MDSISRLDSRIEWRSSNNTYLNNIKIKPVPKPVLSRKQTNVTSQTQAEWKIDTAAVASKCTKIIIKDCKLLM